MSWSEIARRLGTYRNIVWRWKEGKLLAAVLAGLVLVGCADERIVTATPITTAAVTPTAIPTPTPTPVPTPTLPPTPTPRPRPTWTPTITPSPTVTPATTPTATPTAIPTPTPAPTATPPPTATPTATPTAIPTPTPAPTATPPPTATPTATPTALPTPTPLPTARPIPTTLPTPTPLPTATPTPKRECTPQPAQPIRAGQEQAIKASPWVQDPDGVEALRRLAMHAPTAFQALIERFGDYGIEPVAMSYISIALCDEAAALHILEMPLPPLIRLLTLEQEDSSAVAAIQALPWVQDGVTFSTESVTSIHWNMGDYEHQLVAALVDHARHRTGTFWALMDTPWMRDGYTWSNYQALAKIGDIARDDEAAARILRMPFLESLDRDDRLLLQILADLARSDTSSLRQLLSSPRLRDGITDGQLATVAFLDIEVRDPETASLVAALPWIQDGIEPSEQRAVLALRLAAVEGSIPVLQTLLTKPWMQDGLTQDESEVTYFLADLGAPRRHRDEKAALQLANMPFLEAIDSLDSPALRSLWNVQWAWEPGKSYLEHFLSHASVRGGLADDWTNVVAVLSQVTARPELLDVLLDPERTLAEERSITLPLAGDVALSVVWPDAPPISDAAASRLMSHLEDAVRAHEEFMGLPYPKNYAILLVADTGGPIGGGGPTSIIRVAHASYASPSLIDHEVAHTYWPFHPTWIAEGAASFLDSIAARSRAGDPLPEPVDFCSLAENLAELVRLPHDMEEVVYGSGCNYALGEGMFLDLYRGLGNDAFRRAFADLYLLLRDDALVDECRGDDRGACYLKAAFVTDATPRDAAIAEEIINRRYYGTSN